MTQTAQHTELPWHCDFEHGSTEDKTLMKQHGMTPVQALTNEGSRLLMSKGKRVALIDCQTSYKRGQGHQTECAERDANAEFIVRAVNSHDALVAALEEARNALNDMAKDTSSSAIAIQNKAVTAYMRARDSFAKVTGSAA